ncbi:MAG: 2Fe-2S iron-sulfur cluster-binding protein [Candidatus Promineifilaceae bacterium]
MATITASGSTFETKTFEVADGTRLTNAIKAQGIDILHRCGGYGKCTTCRVSFSAGEPADMTEAEATKLAGKSDFRLSCQLTCSGDMAVEVLRTMTSTGLDDAGPDLSADVPA